MDLILRNQSARYMYPSRNCLFPGRDNMNPIRNRMFPIKDNFFILRKKFISNFKKNRESIISLTCSPAISINPLLFLRSR